MSSSTSDSFFQKQSNYILFIMAFILVVMFAIYFWDTKKHRYLSRLTKGKIIKPPTLNYNNVKNRFQLPNFNTKELNYQAENPSKQFLPYIPRQKKYREQKTSNELIPYLPR